YRADDIANFTSTTPQPVVVRGFLDEEPMAHPQLPEDPLKSFATGEFTTAVLRVHALKQNNDWVTASGRARLVVSEKLHGVHIGDEVEVVGRLLRPDVAANPGEFDFDSYLKDQGIRAEIQVRKTAAA